MARGTGFAGVLGKRSHSDQSRELGGLDLTQLGDVSQDGGGEDRADALDLLQSGGFVFQLRILLDVLIDELLHRGDLLFQKLLLGDQQLAQSWSGQRKTTGYLGELGGELPAMFQKLPQGRR